MAIRNIVTLGDDVLRKVCRTQLTFDSKLHTILDDMKETVKKEEGAGLAAPQVAVLRRVVVMDCGDGLIEMINPEIISTEGEQDGPEGCLSVPGRRGMVKRPMIVRARFQDRNGEWHERTAEGFTARAFCHEIDHLDGHLFVERAEKMLSDEELEEYIRQMEEEMEEDED